ncbi:MAG TPA: hypothetical protein VK131_07980 [Candidatus Acidoferrales bacterium]|nr:hypothetical protein [Candidatus Acidoferrales bacterium]
MNLTRPAAGLIAALWLAGCALGSAGSASPARTAPVAASPPSADTPAAALRQALDGLLAEGPYLISALAGAGLEGRDAEFKALGVAVDSNSNDLVAIFTSAYGRDPGAQLSALWKKRVQSLLDYVVALAGKNPDKQAIARRALDQSNRDLADFWSTTIGVPAEALLTLVSDQAASIQAALDDLAAGSGAKRYTDLRTAATRGVVLAELLAVSTARKLPDRYPGEPAGPAGGLRAHLDWLLREHTLLALAADGAIVGGRSPESRAAQGALDGNSEDLRSRLEGYYGPGFGELWARQVQLYADYAAALAGKDKPKQNAALQSLQQWSRDLAAWLNAAAGLPTDPVAALLRDHTLAVKLVLDEEAAGDQLHAAQDLRAAVLQVRPLADAVANATVRKFPARFISPSPSGRSPSVPPQKFAGNSSSLAAGRLRR